MTCQRAAGWVLATLLSVGCGKSQEEKAFERIEKMCEEAPAGGLSPAQALQTFGIDADIVGYVEPQPGAIECRADIASVAPPGSAQNQCVAPAEDPQCPFFLLWVPGDSGLCESTGCCLACELRQNESAISEAGVNPLEVPVCGARFVRGVPC